MNSPSDSSSPFLILLTSLIIGSFSLSSAQPSFWFHYCGTNGNYTSNSSFAANLNTLLSNISSGTPLADGDFHFYNLIMGTAPSDDFVSVQALCRGDLASSDCHTCYSDAVGEIRLICPIQQVALGWYRDCTVRYSNRPIAGIMESSPLLSDVNPKNASDPEAFTRELRVLLKSLQPKAAAKDGWKWANGWRSVNGSQNVYAMMQCTPDLNASSCSNCIHDMIHYVFSSNCSGKIACDIATPNCDLRFDISKFFSSSDEPSSSQPHHGTSRRKRHLGVLLAIIIATLTLVAILLAIAIRIHCQRRKSMDTSYEDIEEIIVVDSLQFDFNTIKIATCNFSFSNKLGQGGFGEVYKGKLENGQEIAVKRLSKNSGQGTAEFKNEVALVAKLQHKNLVKLLGFCLASGEKILVYEFLPNSSLDRFLSDPTKSVSLDWETRYKIILGIARGLLYLHEDSRLKVIHRDLKTSNILLDESMNPKISDFGLAKLFGVDETQGDTKRIVGTYGYMAPEYALTGHFSVKSDVFSFGIIILEIISGQKNRYFSRSELDEALVYRAWRLWNEEKELELIDPSLDNKYQIEEITKCIHIGLLSIQEDPIQRPRMTTIVAALNGDSINLPPPKAPQFVGNSRLSGDVTEESKASSSGTFTGSITNLYPR